jgi:hypothetical protein
VRDIGTKSPPLVILLDRLARIIGIKLLLRGEGARHIKVLIKITCDP